MKQLVAATSQALEMTGEAVADPMRKTREELRDLKVEVAQFASVAEELRRALDSDRARTASGDVVSLAQRRQSH